MSWTGTRKRRKSQRQGGGGDDEDDNGGGNIGIEEEGTVERTDGWTDGLYLNYLGSIVGIHTWDKHCHPVGLSRRHLTGARFIPRGMPQRWKKPTTRGWRERNAQGWKGEGGWNLY